VGDERSSRPAVELAGYYDSDRPELVQWIPAAGARILDVGCGAGAMGAALKARGAREVVGLELIPEVAERARARLDAVLTCDLDRLPELPWPPGSFDLICCADVLEHLVDPWRVLHHLVRWLAPDGQLIACLPNLRHESVVLSLLVDGTFRYQDAGILDRTHLRFFTLREAAALLTGAGLELLLPIRAIRSEPSPYLARAAALVAELGGDAASFRDDATVVQFVLSARRARPPR
jgi:2-polyprenyl-3-methyl-5-hydroxy-6-metoxy-1,4-benzoquinol methylase